MPKLALIPAFLSTFLLAACSSNHEQIPDNSPAKPAQAICKTTSEKEIAELFDRWNNSLLTGDPHKVVSNYAPDSVLLPTLSNVPRLTPASEEEYFQHFLANAPSGTIDSRTIQLGCNTAIDIGLYTFNFAKTGAQLHARYTYTYKWDGQQWLISSHHSSGMPEATPVHP